MHVKLTIHKESKANLKRLCKKNIIPTPHYLFYDDTSAQQKCSLLLVWTVIEFYEQIEEILIDLTIHLMIGCGDLVFLTAWKGISR